MTVKEKLTRVFNACSYGALQRRKVLKPLRGLAKKSQTAAGAFDWLGQQRDLKIVYDASLVEKKVLGRYWRVGKKRQIILSPEYNNDPLETRLDTLVHEIRHAWQDAQGVMLPYNLRYNLEHGMRNAFLQLCLEEADAFAHGRAAWHEAMGGGSPVFEYQKHYAQWFHQKVDVYIKSFVALWGEWLVETEKFLQDDDAGQRIAARIASCRDEPPRTFDENELLTMSGSFAGFNYLKEGDFHLLVTHVLLPAAGEIYDAANNWPVRELEKRVSAIKQAGSLPAATALKARAA